ncbi:MAG: aminotransferase class III-fold pyridoxal phosphate-dependent enzyme [Chloroflexi bacterium]|nr:aminotransferase class III-fold pyridoxal phosphate-dependent enzyme [Chloroflexota bacterium]
MSRITEEYIKKHPKSAKLAEAGLDLFPGGVTHDNRRFSPFPVYMDRGQGAHKWDVDGNEYIDYRIGHGSMILGHSHPAIVKAVTEAIAKGSHLSSSTELEVKWGNKVRELMPSVEKLRFHNSGTEAVMMAFRMVRVFTGKTKIIKFQDAFHGWADGPYVGTDLDQPGNGIPEQTRETMVILPYDLGAVERTLNSDSDIAAVIFQGNVVIEPTFVQKLRVLTERKGVLLIIDEVVSGFRWSRSGAQGIADVTPDLSTMAKILAGGLPGGAVGGRAEVIDTISKGKIAHPGTFNANPLSAAAGSTALSIVANEPIGEIALGNANRLKAGLNDVLTKLEVPGCVYGVSSILHTRFGADHECDHTYCKEGAKAKGGWSKDAKDVLVQALANRGVYAWADSMILSAAHTDELIDKTVDAFEDSLNAMRADGTI